MSSNLGLFAVFLGLDWGYRFWGLASGVKYPFLLYHVWWHKTSQLFTGQPVNVVSARLLHRMARLSPFPLLVKRRSLSPADIQRKEN